MKVVESLFKKKLMVKNSFIEKKKVVGTHWNCLIEATFVTENKEENYSELTFSKYHAHFLYLY